jgi:hypothetical protein
MYQGHPAGRDPREMTQDELREAGHEPMSPLQALRARCLDCCAYQEKEVALCPAVDCPSWPFRMGTDPWRKSASEARREAARQTMTKLNSRRRKQDGTAPSASPPDDGTAPLSAEGSGAAPIWATGRVDQAPETVLHRVEAGATGQRAEPSQGVPIAVGDDVVTTARLLRNGGCG